MIDFEKYRIKYRYNHFLRPFFDALSKLGIRISILYIFQQDISSVNLNKSENKLDTNIYKISFLGADEIKEMALIPDREITEEALLERIRNKNKCMGIKTDNKIIAFSWCNLKEISYKWHRRRLKPHEAYMFDLYTLPEYRGKGLAPFFSYYFYQELAKIGITNLISYHDYFNRPSIKFKQKLNAQKISLELYIILFNKWRYRLNIKNYQKAKHPENRQ